MPKKIFRASLRGLTNTGKVHNNVYKLLLERDEAARVGGTDTGTTVSVVKET